MRIIAQFTYAVSILVAASLMFLVEPYIAKLLLPAFGGGPNVWNTSVLFFQAVLLLGYCYSHLLSTRLPPSRQFIIHLLVVWSPVLLLPVRAPLVVPEGEIPSLSIMLLLASMVGAMFFSISTTAPLLQKWYAEMRGLGLHDPYVLYAASNVGGILGLVSYPFLVEPKLTLAEQSQLLSVLYICFAVLISTCGILVCRFGSQPSNVGKADSQQSLLPDSKVETSGVGPSWISIFRWLTLTMIPSSLVLGLTGFVTSQLSSIPLFWMIPLLIYLVSFILAFGKTPDFIIHVFRMMAPLAVLLAILSVVSINVSVYLWQDDWYLPTLLLHALALFFVCVSCHGMVAQERPNPKYLTGYFLCISIGGVLGSFFNAIIAPFVFKGCDEYFLVLLIAGVLLVQSPRSMLLFKKLCRGSRSRLKLRTPSLSLRGGLFLNVTVVGACTAVAWSAYDLFSRQPEVQPFVGETGQLVIDIASRFLVPYLVILILAKRTLEYKSGLSVLAVFAFACAAQIDPAVVFQARNFFGTVSVRDNKLDNACELWNGLSLHGVESLDPAKRAQPYFYMYRDGPIGRLADFLFAESNELVNTSPRLERKLDAIGVIGLGCGTGASLARPDQTIVFYEINPQVITLAQNPFYFTYLYEAKKRNVDVRVVCGDGRMAMQKAPYRFYKLIISDVYSSNYIPIHTITKEAVELYFRKLTDDGVVVVNTTNSIYKLWPVFAALAPELGLTAYWTQERDRTPSAQSLFATHWIALSKDPKVICHLEKNGWIKLKPDPKLRVWTDDYSNPLGLMTK
ncbi:MAG: fused MFS/spermidine synthase [Candidatus Obscuribacterales bacterium]|nr:fused MFS/spermidine synthase [Candidatus Obscuribacterales bacterium]